MRHVCFVSAYHFAIRIDIRLSLGLPFIIPTMSRLVLPLYRSPSIVRLVARVRLVRLLCQYMYAILYRWPVEVSLAALHAQFYFLRKPS